MARATSVVRLLSGAKEPVRLASTANIALSGLLTVDGVVTVAGDRVLVKNQTDATQNGIYTASEGAWYRAGDSNSDRTLIKGMLVFVQEGTQANSIWILSTDRPDIGSDSISFGSYLTTDIIATAAASAAAAAASAAAAAASAAVFLVSVPSPQGRLTLTSGTPVLSSDVTAATTVYYTPYVGSLVPIYNGTSMVPTEFAELSLLLNSNHLANTIYDVFVFLNAGVATIGTGPAWSNSAAAAGARGSGGGTTQLSRVKGIWTNTVSMTARNGSTTYTVGPNLGVYLGSILIDGSAGQVTCHSSYGQSRRWGVWNAYNRRQIRLKAGDASTSWTSINASGIHAANTNSANSLTVFCGLPEEVAELQYSSRAAGAITTGLVMSAQVGIGFNSTSAMSGKIAHHQLDNSTASTISVNTALNGAKHIPPPWIGTNVITALENTNGSGITVSFLGGEDDMMLTAAYRA